MSGFLSDRAERVLLNEEDPATIFEHDTSNQYPPQMSSSAELLDPRWALAHTTSTGEEWYHPDTSQAVFTQWEVPPQGLQQPELPGSSISRSHSPRATDLDNYGFLNSDQQTWRCAYPGCSSKARFSRACDLRKHFNRHSKNFFCRHDGCPQATEGGFSSKKDRARHEAKHNPGVACEWEGCERIFSRVDNMKDHVRRIHKKGS